MACKEIAKAVQQKVFSRKLQNPFGSLGNA